MPQDTALKLTKKQRKGLAFRQKLGRRKGAKPEPDDVPESENLDALDVEPSTTKINGKGKEKEKKTQAEAIVTPKDADQPSKKRKRADADDLDPKSKKRKQKAPEADENAENEDAKDELSGSTKQKVRYILFVGNLKYSTSKEDIQAHFAHCDPPPTVRLLTSKPKSPSSDPSKLSTKSKGCAFLEFTHGNALQQALKLHHSNVDGRQINVELTAGGGGKSSTRIEKLKGRNRALEVQRTKQLKISSVDHDDVISNQPTAPSHTQRHSSTSGITEAPTATRRTWSVPEEGDEGTHRGGVKHATAKKRGAKKGKKDLGTGVNAIPVG